MRKNKIATINGMTVKQLSDATGFPSTIIYRRLKLGWSDFDIINTPVDQDRLILGMTVEEVAKKLNCHSSVIFGRVKKGWSDHEIVTVPSGGKRPVQIRLTPLQVLAKDLTPSARYFCGITHKNI
jgi:hypothetical protein